MEEFSILLVDHNLNYLDACRNILNVHNDIYRIENATTSEDCIRKILQQHYDVVLLNYKVNDEDGLNLLGRIKALKRNLPVIMLVDEKHESIAASALDQGADDYIMKVSGDQTALPFTIKKVIERNRIHQASEPPPAPEPDNFFTEVDPAQSSNPFYIIDQKGRFLSANEKMVAICGYTEDELLELSLVDLLPQEEEYQFQQWFSRLCQNGDSAVFSTELVTKYGQRQPVNFELNSMKNKAGNVVAFQGRVLDLPKTQSKRVATNGHVDQYKIVSELVEAINNSLHEPMNYLLERITQICAQLFQFERVTLALLDRKKRVFVKQSMVGYHRNVTAGAPVLEVPAEVINKIFTDQYKLKVMYYGKDGIVDFENQRFKQHLYHEDWRDHQAPTFQWQEDDLFIVNLVDQNQHTFGYLSLEKPLNLSIIQLEIAENLQIFAKLASMAIENHYHYSMLERRNRRLKQLLITSNIFKLYLNLNDLLKEVVWSIKFSLDFNLVGMALVSSKSGMLELRAIACDDKIKQMHLQELRFSLNAIAIVLNEHYKRSKSYFIEDKQGTFKPLKDIYYGARRTNSLLEWRRSYLLLVPIKARDQKISGFIIVDDPSDGKIPDLEVFRTLEIIANQVGIAIDNRMMYFQMRKRLRLLESAQGLEHVDERAPAKKDLQHLVDKFFK